MGQSAISHQLRVLKQMLSGKVQADGETVFYSLADGHIETILAQGMEHIWNKRKEKGESKGMKDY